MGKVKTKFDYTKNYDENESEDCDVVEVSALELGWVKTNFC